MAIHGSLPSMLRESMKEYLYVAGYCTRYRKAKSWPLEQRGGCLGFPAGAMLLAIADAIGSFYRGSQGLAIRVDGKAVSIKRDGFQHFFILNSEYYGQQLSQKAIKQLYESFRNILLHNAALAPEKCLVMESGKGPFPVIQGRQCVDVTSFLAISRPAVKKFLARADSLAETSKQARNIAWKR
jgi:hypothetical protein